MAAHGNGGRGFAGALHGLNTLLALGGCVFLAPMLWPLVDGPLWAALIALYGGQTTYWLHTIAWAAMWPISFFAIRMALSLLFAVVGLMLARRLM